MQPLELTPTYNEKYYTLRLDKWQLEEIRNALIKIENPKLVISDNLTVYNDEMTLPKRKPLFHIDGTVHPAFCIQRTQKPIPKYTKDEETIHKIRPSGLIGGNYTSFVLSGK